MLTHEETDVLCRVEGDAPTGQLMLLQAKLRSYQAIVGKAKNWRTLGASGEEIRISQSIEEDETERQMARSAVR